METNEQASVVATLKIKGLRRQPIEGLPPLQVEEKLTPKYIKEEQKLRELELISTVGGSEYFCKSLENLDLGWKTGVLRKKVNLKYYARVIALSEGTETRFIDRKGIMAMMAFLSLFEEYKDAFRVDYSGGLIRMIIKDSRKTDDSTLNSVMKHMNNIIKSVEAIERDKGIYREDNVISVLKLWLTSSG